MQVQNLPYCKLRSLIYTSILVIAAEPRPLMAQDGFQVRMAEPVSIPLVIDSNTAGFWQGLSFRFFSSSGRPMITTIDEGMLTSEVQIDSTAHFPMWIESVWQAADGTLYGWYHHEKVGVCPGTELTIPEIGALVSYDGGISFSDLGIVLRSSGMKDCSAQNGYFANGHGDFSVILDREGRYFYFLTGAYGGEVSEQGVAIMRMSINDLADPVGKVWKYHNGGWSEPGLGGQVTPVFQAISPWQGSSTDSFWGPSIHWNTYLQKFVILMNRSCCAAGWPQEGIYLTTTSDISNPASWSTPVKILDYNDWYPWVLGTGPGETSAEAGKTVRLFVRNFSEWEIVFQREDELVLDRVKPPPSLNPFRTN
jgi:hypothetical protein